MQFGTILPEEFVTLVSSRFENLSVMDGTPDLNDLISGLYADDGSDDVSDVVGDPALSPGALARLELEQTAVDERMPDVGEVQDVVRPVQEPERPVFTPVVPPAPGPVATQGSVRCGP